MLCNYCVYSKIVKSSVRSFSLSFAHHTHKKPNHWHYKLHKKTGPIKALEHFDDFYKSVFRLRWPSVRLGLLSPQKYVALVNNFGDKTNTTAELENLGAININELFKVWKRNYPLTVQDDDDDTKARDKLEAVEHLMEEKTRRTEDAELVKLYPEGKQGGLEILGEAKPIGDDQFQDPDRIIDGDIDSGSLHEFIPATKLKGMEDYVPESEYYAYYKSSADVPVGSRKQYELNFPENLKVFSFDRGVFDKYPPPKICSTGVYNYFLLDGASILPVIALGVEKNDVVLDMCSAPGGKALALLQEMNHKFLFCNDYSSSRVKRIHKVFNQFLYDYSDEEDWKGILSVQQSDGRFIEDTNTYDKILVDVPCTNDRLSLTSEENNMFKESRMKERFRIPELQAGLLINALKIVKPGGTVVYSTCSLSPVQNDGVVGMALRQLWDQHKMKFTVVDMTPCLQCTSHLFSYNRGIGVKYGQLIVPFLPSNFGPMYFAKLIKDN